MSSISTIYVNFLSKDNLLNSIESFKDCIDLAPYEFIIVNNSYEKFEFSEINQNYRINVINSQKNIGFGAANNLAVTNSDSEFILFLNPDTLFVEDFADHILQFIHRNPKAGACAPMLVYEDGKYQDSTGFRFGFLYELIEALMIIRINRWFRKRAFLKKSILNTPFKVGWVSAACLLIRRSAFEKLKGFDEDFFLNYEDLDLCRRLEDAGYENYYFPQFKCVHLDHRSFGKDYEMLVFSRYKSRVIFAEKHYNFLQRQVIRVIHILTILLRIISGYMIFRGEERKSRLKGYYRALQLYLR